MIAKNGRLKKHNHNIYLGEMYATKVRSVEETEGLYCYG